MRPTLFRTPPILVNGTDVEVLLKDLHGANPVTLYMENLDTHAKLRVQNGDKNAQLIFSVTDPGTAGDSITLTVTTGASQAYSLSNVSNDWTLALPCDAQGIPTKTAVQIMDLVNDEIYGPFTVTLAPGSDGSAHMAAMAKTSMAGGLDAVTAGTCHVYHRPTIDAEGEDESTAAGTAFTGITAGAVKAFMLDAPVRGLRVTLSKGSGNTYVVLTGVRGLDA